MPPPLRVRRRAVRQISSYVVTRYLPRFSRLGKQGRPPVVGRRLRLGASALECRIPQAAGRGRCGRFRQARIYGFVDVVPIESRQAPLMGLPGRVSASRQSALFGRPRATPISQPDKIRARRISDNIGTANGSTQADGNWPVNRGLWRVRRGAAGNPSPRRSCSSGRACSRTGLSRGSIRPFVPGTLSTAATVGPRVDSRNHAKRLGCWPLLTAWLGRPGRPRSACRPANPA